MSEELVIGAKQFKCPHCNVLSKQDWTTANYLSDDINELYQQIFLDYRKNISSHNQEYVEKFLNSSSSIIKQSFSNVIPKELAIAKCHSCHHFSLWVGKKIVYPKNVLVDEPNSDMDEDIQSLYVEASLILIDSPKGAAALLRLALQKLLLQIGGTEKNIDKNIKKLVSEGLNPKIQKALDFVRVVGNEAVHPGEINLDDNKEIARSLFKILNLIANDMITIPKEMDDLYEDIIPDEKKEQINVRDRRN